MLSFLPSFPLALQSLVHMPLLHCIHNSLQSICVLLSPSLEFLMFGPCIWRWALLNTGWCEEWRSRCGSVYLHAAIHLIHSGWVHGSGSTGLWCTGVDLLGCRIMQLLPFLSVCNDYSKLPLFQQCIRLAFSPVNACLAIFQSFSLSSLSG